MLKDKYLQHVIEDNGYCLLDVLDKKALNQLHHLYQTSIAPKVDKEFYANHNTDKESAWDISQQICSIVDECFQKSFENFEYFIGHFSVKSANSTYEFHLHQDWSIVDENHHKSYQVWIPLQNVSPENGGLYLLKNSHRALTLPRSNSLGIPIVQANEQLKKYISSIYLGAGQAVVFQNNVLHGSYPNHNEEDRVGIIVNIVEKNAPTYFFDLQQEQLCKYRINAKLLLDNLVELELKNVPKDFELVSKESFQQDYISSQLDATILLEKLSDVGIQPYDKIIFKILRDSELQRKLDVEGYAVVSGLSENTIHRLTDINANYSKNTGDASLNISLEDAPIDIKQQIHTDIEKAVTEDLSVFFENHQFPIFTTFSKSPGENTEVVLHTDTALLLNADIEPHYGIWIPLTAVDESSGTLSVVPGSHHWYNAPVTIGQDWPFGKHISYIESLKISISLKKGEFVIFDNRLIHGSSPNLTSKNRDCIVGRVTNSQSQYYNLYALENGFTAYKRNKNTYLEKNWKNQSTEDAEAYIGEFPTPCLDDHLFPKLAIEVNHLSKKYVYNQVEKFALSDLNLKIYEGQTIGIIGSNGSGKSTLLNILSGIVKPSGGSAKIYGDVVSILDIGSNFHPDLTGEENAKLFLKFYQIPSHVIKQYLEEALVFSELGDYFYQPIKTYSKGMFLRLAFSVMFKIEADIYLIDEVMSMGDEAFKLKSASILNQLKEKKKTILLASHDRNEIFQYTQTCFWLDHGKLKKSGDTTEVLKEYSKFQNSRYYHSIGQNSIDSVRLDKSNAYAKDFTEDPIGNELLQLKSISLISSSSTIRREEDFQIVLKIEGAEVQKSSVLIKILNEFQQPVLLSADIMEVKNESEFVENGWSCEIPKNLLTAGEYTIQIYFGKLDKTNHHFNKRLLAVEDTITFVIESNDKEFISNQQHCSIQMPLKWKKL